MTIVNHDLEFDFELAAEIAATIGAKPKQCWKNCILGVTSFPELMYVEGYAIVSITEDMLFPIEHGWLVKADGTIVEPTLIGREPVAYVEGRRWAEDEIEDVLFGERNGVTPLAFPPHLVFPEAYRAADEFAFGPRSDSE